MGGVHLPKYAGPPISGGTAVHEDSCFDESKASLPDESTASLRRGSPLMTILPRACRAAGAEWE
jgi:hypothetical protein